mmetsp:Transcript_14958/g.32510  ORF Transcript_14958/g.32510 Transcript_14958/m.32510 type:complete len:299 (-) Transcript_14958:222-1118(-)
MYSRSRCWRERIFSATGLMPSSTCRRSISTSRRRSSSRRTTSSSSTRSCSILRSSSATKVALSASFSSSRCSSSSMARMRLSLRPLSLSTCDAAASTFDSWSLCASSSDPALSILCASAFISCLSCSVVARSTPSPFCSAAVSGVSRDRMPLSLEFSLSMAMRVCWKRSVTRLCSPVSCSSRAANRSRSSVRTSTTPWTERSHRSRSSCSRRLRSSMCVSCTLPWSLSFVIARCSSVVVASTCVLASWLCCNDVSASRSIFFSRWFSASRRRRSSSTFLSRCCAESRRCDSRMVSCCS